VIYSIPRLDDTCYLRTEPFVVDRMKKRIAQALGRPYIWILMLALGAALVYASLLVLAPDASVLRAWLSRFTVTLLGSYIIAVLVDLNLRRRDEEHQDRIRNTALEELHKSMNRHIRFLHNMYKASISDPPEPVPESFEEVLQSDFYDRVSHLNFAATYPTANLGPDHTWLDESEKLFSEIQDDIDVVIGKYGAFLSPEMMQDFRDLSNSDLSGAIITTGKSPFLSGKNIHPSSDLSSHPLMQPNTEFFPLLAEESWEESVVDHVDAVLRVIEYYETSETPDLALLTSESRWRDDITPHVGSARLPSSHPAMPAQGDDSEPNSSDQSDRVDEQDTNGQFTPIDQ
jgi:hypothetical protein